MPESPLLFPTDASFVDPGSPNRLTLSFPDPVVERDYALSFYEQNIVYMRVVAVLFTLVVLVGGPLEQLALPELAPALRPLRYGILFPIGLLGMTLLGAPRLSRWFAGRGLQELVLVIMASGYAGTGAMGVVILEQHTPLLQLYTGVGYVMTTLFLYIGIRLRFLYAMLLGLTTWLCGVAAHLVYSSDPFVTQAVIVIGGLANLVGIYGAYTIERSDRLQFVSERAIARERWRVEHMLALVLPPTIADRLRNDPARIADGHEHATVVFADIVGFTVLSGQLEASVLVALLNRLFWAFDSSAERHGVEKIKTIGDAWMAVSGAPNPQESHAFAVARVALELVRVVDQVAAETGHAINIRVGVHSGRLVAGIIGQEKFLYDLWGETVNIASRMESMGEPGRVQVSDTTRQLLADAFEFQLRGPVAAQGPDDAQTWWLLGERTSRGDA